jgi:transposase
MIPGVGTVTLDVFLAETADVRRFGSQKKLTAYAGLSPGVRESAGKRRELGITHTGSRVLRWVLVQAAWQLVQRDAHWRRIFDALAKRRGKKKAIVAIARRLLCLMMAMVVNDRPYRNAA